MVFKQSPFKPRPRYRKGLKKIFLFILGIAIVGAGFFSAKPIMSFLGSIEIGSNSSENTKSISEPATSGSIQTGNEPDIPESKEIRAVYLPTKELTPEGMNSFINFAKENNINGVVIDLKDSDGILIYESTTPRAVETGAIAKAPADINNIVMKLKDSGIYTIARLICFKDAVSSSKDYTLAVQISGGGRWRYNHQRWLNAYEQRNWEYLTAIGLEAADIGFDEIMLDEVKFPDKGSLQLIDYGEASSTLKSDAVNNFVNFAADKLHEKKVKVSLSAPPSAVIDKGTSESGQIFDFSSLKVDILSPRFEPSSFRIDKSTTIGGTTYSEPEQAPADIITAALTQTNGKLKAANSKILIRPFLQCYDANGVTFGAAEAKLQSDAALNADSIGYIFFNEIGKYELKQE